MGIVLIVTLIIFIWNWEDVTEDFGSFCGGLFFSSLASGVSLMVAVMLIGIFTPNITTYYKTEVPIFSSKLGNAETTGHGSGWVLGFTLDINSDRYFYFYYQRTDGDLQLDRRKAVNVAIRRTDNESPKLVREYEHTGKAEIWKTILYPLNMSSDSLIKETLIVPTSAIEINIHDLNIK